MVDLIEPSGDVIREHPAHTVYTRETWSGIWLERPYLYCDRFSYGTGPNKGQAQFSWRYGRGIQPNKDVFASYEPKDLLDHYVKVSIDQGEDDPILWYGVIADVGNVREGALDFEGNRLLTGEQTLVAYTLDFLLERTFLTGCWVWRFVDGEEIYIRRALEFNAENAFANTGNRSATPGSQGVYLFTDRLSNASEWSSRDILQYLLKLHSPQDHAGFVMMPWELSTRALDSLCDWDKPRIKGDGRDLRSIITQVCDRRRNLDWTVTVEDRGGEMVDVIRLDTFSFNTEPLMLPSGKVQQANLEQYVLDFDRALDVEARLKDSAAHQVDQVIVRGARKRAVFSVSPLDYTLEGDWNAADEAAYEAGPAGIEGLDIYVREWRVREFRQSDLYERVYSWFRLPADWDGEVGDGVGGQKSRFFPDDPEYGEEPIYIPELRFERLLPRGLITTAPTDSPDEQPRPFALILLEDDTKYQYVDKLKAASETEGNGDGDGRKWSCSLRMQEDAPGIILKVQNGPEGNAPHILAATDFTPIADVDRHAPELDWRDNLIATVMIELDSRVEEKYPATADLPVAADVCRKVYIDVGDRARLDYVHAGCVLGHADGVLQYPPAAYYIRDDREYMQDVARLAFDWYGVKRQAFTFVIKQVIGLHKIGDLITQIGSVAEGTAQEVNSVVTGLTIDLAQGRTELTTSFAELDFLQL